MPANATLPTSTITQYISNRKYPISSPPIPKPPTFLFYQQNIAPGGPDFPPGGGFGGLHSHFFYFDSLLTDYAALFAKLRSLVDAFFKPKNAPIEPYTKPSSSSLSINPKDFFTPPPIETQAVYRVVQQETFIPDLFPFPIIEEGPAPVILTSAEEKLLQGLTNLDNGLIILALKEGADPFKRLFNYGSYSNDLVSALEIAIFRNCPHLFRIINESSKNQSFAKILNTLGPSGYTPLMLICAGGSDKVLRLATELEGLDFNVRDAFGDTALHYAAANGQVKIIERLIRAKKTGKAIETNIKSFDDHATPLQLAIQKGYMGVVQALFQDPDLIIDRYAYKDAIQLGVGTEYDPRDGNLIPPTAEEIELSARIIRFLNSATDHKKIDVDMNVLCAIALEANNLEALKALFEHPEVEINKRLNERGNTFLHLAAYKNYTPIVDFLRTLPGIDRNVVNKEGLTYRDILESNGTWGKSKL